MGGEGVGIGPGKTINSSVKFGEISVLILFVIVLALDWGHTT